MLTEESLRRLELKQEELALLFLEQTGVDDWKDLSTSTRRGDVYWYKKNAGQTMTLIVKIQSLLNLSQRLTGRDGIPEVPPAEADQARLIEKANRDAVDMIERVRTKAEPAKR
jgi:hypothetical protein